jgi:hypothetical protein
MEHSVDVRPRQEQPSYWRGIRSFGKPIKMVDHAQGWQGLQAPDLPALIDGVGEPEPRALDLRGLGAR